MEAGWKLYGKKNTRLPREQPKNDLGSFHGIFFGQEKVTILTYKSTFLFSLHALHFHFVPISVRSKKKRTHSHSSPPLQKVIIIILALPCTLLYTHTQTERLFSSYFSLRGGTGQNEKGGLTPQGMDPPTHLPTYLPPTPHAHKSEKGEPAHVFQTDPLF